jgi:hypothetical protein
MNLGQLKKNIGWRVQLVPTACRLGEDNRELPLIDDDWIIGPIVDARINISNTRTGHTIILGKDHIHNFSTNPARPLDGNKYGFLILHVQIFLQGRKCWLRPNARPGDAVKPPISEIREKWVDNRYPFLSGIQQKIEADGYGQELYLGQWGLTTMDTEWLCPNDNCPSKRKF